VLRTQDPSDFVQPASPGEVSGNAAPSEAATAAFVHDLAIAFRNHPHLNNVLTHVGLGRWERIERALAEIFSSASGGAGTSPLAGNLVELLWAERGIPGRIAKPFLLAFCRTVPAPAAGHWLARLAARQAELSPPPAAGNSAGQGGRPEPPEPLDDPDAHL
jgi:hypothetical protein